MIGSIKLNYAMKEGLMKIECIREEALMDYFNNKLTEEERVVIEEHLSECDDCLELMKMMSRMINASEDSKPEWTSLKPVPEHVTKKAIESVWAINENSIKKENASFLSRVFSLFIDKIMDFFTFRTLVPVAVRSKKKDAQNDFFIVHKTISDLAVEIEFEKRPLNRALIRILVAQNPLPKEPLRVALFSADREVSSFTIKESAVTFQEVPFGHYTLVFFRSGQKLGNYSFEVKDTLGEKNETGSVYFQSDSFHSDQH